MGTHKKVLNMILFAILKYHSSYSLENGVLWGKSGKIIGVWIRPDDDVSYSSGCGHREKRNSCTKYMSIRFLTLKIGCLVIGILGKTQEELSCIEVGIKEQMFSFAHVKHVKISKTTFTYKFEPQETVWSHLKEVLCN